MRLVAGKCILAWAVQKEPVWCPQCKAPFTNLLTYRKLDGTLSDFPVEESVCLLKRAHWFEAHMKVQFCTLAVRFPLHFVRTGKAHLNPLPAYQISLKA